MKKTLFAIIITLAMTLPDFALAQLFRPGCPPGLLCPGEGGLGGAASNINGLIATVIGWMLSIAFGLAVLFLIIGGFRYILSAGNEEAAEAAKSTIINTLIGIVLIILSYVIINVIVNFIGGAPTAP